MCTPLCAQWRIYLRIAACCIKSAWKRKIRPWARIPLSNFWHKCVHPQLYSVLLTSVEYMHTCRGQWKAKSALKAKGIVQSMSIRLCMKERNMHGTVMYSFVILVDPLISWALKCFISIALIAIFLQFLQFKFNCFILQHKVLETWYLLI